MGYDKTFLVIQAMVEILQSSRHPKFLSAFLRMEIVMKLKAQELHWWGIVLRKMRKEGYENT